MTDELTAALHLAMVAAIAWAVICRARLMDGETDRAVRLQHGLLNAGALASLGVPEHWRVIVMAGGVAAFLALSAPRWRHAAPADTRPAELDGAEEATVVHFIDGQRRGRGRHG